MKIKEILKNKWGWIGAVITLLLGIFYNGNFITKFLGENIYPLFGISYLEILPFSLTNFILPGILHLFVGFLIGFLIYLLFRRKK
jgi:hypothetical protein